MTPTREQALTPAELRELCAQLSEDGQAMLHRAVHAAHMSGLELGRDQGLREAKEALSVSEHMHARNGGLMLCISDLSAVIVRMAAGIDHLSETARRWEPDHSSGADRRGWVLATEARDHALRLLKEHAAAIEQLRGK